jgi:hypothetical protein
MFQYHNCMSCVRVCVYVCVITIRFHVRSSEKSYYVCFLSSAESSSFVSRMHNLVLHWKLHGDAQYSDMHKMKPVEINDNTLSHSYVHP